MARLITKNWTEFQHYKDRSPPWIKLHKELLDDRHYQSLPLASRALAPMLWLLASETKDGSFDADPEELAFRLRTNVKDITTGLKPLIDKGFFVVLQDASSVLADCVQVAVPETEAERETETKKEGEAKRASRIPPNFWPTPEPEAEAGIDYKKELANFRDYWTAKSGANATKLDWQATWRQWARKADRPGVSRFAKPDPTATVPGKPGRDPELTRLEIERRRAVPPPQNIREQMQNLKLGVPA